MTDEKNDLTQDDDNNINFYEGDIGNLFTNNNTVNFTMNNFGEDKKQTQKNEPTVLTFPSRPKDTSFMESELLDLRRIFYRKYRWLILESNNKNFSLISEAIATLISFDNNHQYIAQQIGVNCEDYIRYRDKFTNKLPSICQLKVNYYELKSFFEIPEKVIKLTECLEQTNNILLLTVENNDNNQQLKTLTSLVTNESNIAYWRPIPKEQTEQNFRDIFQLNWLERNLITISSWFSGLPFKALHQITLNLLQKKHQMLLTDSSATGQLATTETKNISEEQTTHDSKTEKPKTQLEFYEDWLAQWRNSPDIILHHLSLANCSDPNGERYGIRFTKPELALKYRAESQDHLSFHMQEILEPLMAYTFTLSISDTKHSDIFVDLANFLTQLHQTRLINLDSEYLIGIFERCRFINLHTFNEINRFIELLAMLYQHPEGQKAVISLLEKLAQQIIVEQKILMDRMKFDIQILRRLPKQMADLAKKANEEEIANIWYQLKDKLYATLKLLAAIGISETPCINVFERLVAENYGIDKAKVNQLPCATISQSQLIDNLQTNSDDFYNILTNSAVITDKKTAHFPKIILTLRTVLEAQINSIHNSSGNALNFFYAVIILKDGAKHLAWLLFAPEKTSLTLFERTLTAISLFKMTVLLIEQTDADQESLNYALLDIELRRFLNLTANYSTREDYRHLKQYCQSQLDKQRQAATTITSKKERKTNKILIEAHSFVKRYFSKKHHNGDC